jgi:hypothetical protein
MIRDMLKGRIKPECYWIVKLKMHRKLKCECHSKEPSGGFQCEEHWNQMFTLAEKECPPGRILKPATSGVNFCLALMF